MKHRVDNSAHDYAQAERARQLALWASTHTEEIERYARETNTPFDRGDTFSRVSRVLYRCGKWSASQEEASHHEAGHTIAYQAFGWGMDVVEISSSRKLGAGWGGRAHARNDPFGDPCCTPSFRDYMEDAAATFAGPIAEALFGGGDVRAHVSELVFAQMRIQQGVKLHASEGTPKVMAQSLRHSAKLVEINEAPLREIAQALLKRRRIEGWSRSVKSILARVKNDCRGHKLSDRGERLCCEIEAVLREFWRGDVH